MKLRKVLIFLFVVLIPWVAFPQSARLSGRVMDSTGSIMPGVQIRVYDGEKVIGEAITAANGDFDVPLPPGEYKLEVAAPDFSTFTEIVKVTSDMGPLAVTMQLAQISQDVEVTTTRNQIDIDPDSSLNTTVLDREFIDALPEDEDELTDYLQQIAGSRGGAGGTGDFVIDGFSNGRVPPKDQIQEIRINNNPYSAEFSGLGFGRLEIVTRAGTGDYHGSMNFNFKDEALNARNPFAAVKPGYQQRNLNSNFSGPIIRNKLSLNMNLRNSENENSDTIRAVLPSGQLAIPVVLPNINRSLNARTQWAITKNNTMNVNFEYETRDNKNQGVGGFNLLERASVRRGRNMEFQVRETAILSKSIIHEIRFEFRRDRSQQTPTATGMAINVLDSFFGGGGQNRSLDNDRRFEFSNLLMYSGSKWTIKAGTQGDYRLSHAVSENNFIGTFTFSSLDCRTGLDSSPILDSNTDPRCAGAYNAGRPTTFSRNQGDPLLDVNQFQIGTFLQTDLKVTKTFNLSMGVRHQDQTNISDHNNFDPRLGFAYQLSKRMALRGGLGMFHQRLDSNTVEQLLRFDGTRQLQIVLTDRQAGGVSPVVSWLNYLNGLDPLANIPAAAAPAASIRVAASDLVTPYNINNSLSFETSLPAGVALTFSWDSIRGVHLLRSRNINAPLPGTTVRPDPTKGNITQLESTGSSRSNNFTVGFRQTLRNKSNLTVFGNYTLGHSSNDTDNPFSLPANNYDLRSEWSRSPQDARHRFFTGVNFRMPWGVNVNTIVNGSSSRPFNITTGFDDNGDTVTNDRPVGVKRNTGAGPSSFTMNLNLTKTVNLKHPEPSPDAARNAGGNTFAEPQRGGPGGGFPRGPGGGQDGRGGGPGGPGGRRPGGPGGLNQQRVPTMAFQVNIQNLLNHVQLGQYSGVLTSPFFGRANSARNARQIELGLRFNF
jgi:hypothetical protein